MRTTHVIMGKDSNYADALARFQKLLRRAETTQLQEPAAMSLATADLKGRPTLRIVLLRGFDERGFVFFTNSESRKGEQLAVNPHAAICFYWDELGEQVRIEGVTNPISNEESNAYWSKRPRESQIASSASKQSQVLPDRRTFERDAAELESKLTGQAVPRPPNWFGYRVIPSRIEFWTRRDARMHERTIYEKVGDDWTTYCVYP